MLRIRQFILIILLLLSLPSWGKTAEKTLSPSSPDTLCHMTARLSVGSGVVKGELLVSVTDIDEGVLPKLDRGLTNVTDSVPGYRFLPHGEHFQGNGAKVVLGYDRTKIPSGYTEDDIRTYYYDEAEGHWVALKRDSVDRRNRLVVSHTTHFTDMINGVIQVDKTDHSHPV